MSVTGTMLLMSGTFLLTRHTQVRALGGLLAPVAMLAALYFARWSPRRLVWSLPVLGYSMLSLVAGLVAGVAAADSFRFLLITLGTLIAAHAWPRRLSLPLVLAPIVLQAAIVAGISLFLSVSQDAGLGQLFRFSALDNEWGDIYTHDGIYYRVQLIGNALLPVLFMISAAKFHAAPIYRLSLVLAGLSVIAAGNLTYIIVCLLYGFVLLLRAKPRFAGQRVVVSFVAAVLLALYGLSFLFESIEAKSGSSESSIGVRLDQAEVVFDAFAEHPVKAVVGFGLGARLPDGRERNYSEYNYIEMQALYFLYQLGILGFALYLFGLLAALQSSLNRDGLLIFWMYVLSGLSNPYLLDSNQIIVTILLVCTFGKATGCRK